MGKCFADVPPPRISSADASQRPIPQAYAFGPRGGYGFTVQPAPTSVTAYRQQPTSFAYRSDDGVYPFVTGFIIGSLF